MVLAELTVTSLPVLVSFVIVVGTVFLLLLCVCGKKSGAEDEPQLTSVHNKRLSAAPAQNGFVQPAPVASEAVVVDIDTAVTPLNTSMGSQNSTSNHSRGASLDLTNNQRQSGTSSGSSPRPSTLSRELPDIPRKDHNHHDDRKSHAHLPEIPVSVSRNNMPALERNSHAHTQLPQVPKPVAASPGTSAKGSNSPGKNRLTKQETGRKDVTDMAESQEDKDDYDHIPEKQSRPRSDYDHIVIEGDVAKIIARKQKSTDEDDYSEVADEKPENIYEGVPEEPGGMVIPPPITSEPIPKKKTAKDNYRNIEDPYNTIELNDPPYNKIKDELEKDDVLYIDDIDPYDDVKDETNGKRSSIGKQKAMRKTPQLIDPYSFVDDERNVSNQTDPYARVADSEVEDPYNRVNDDDSDISRAPMRSSPMIYTDEDYATVNKTGEVEYAKVNKASIRDRHRNSGAVNDLDLAGGNSSNGGASGNIPSSPREEIIHDEYATVVKIRKLSPGPETPSGASSSSEGHGQMTTTSHPTPGQSAVTPPEPPRGYEQDGGVDTDHYNTVVMVAGDSTSSELGATGQKKEPPYNKLSVRESLASMNARVASNTYEYVSEVDNLYATVDGNSGDGVVTKPKSPANPALQESKGNEYYAEIEGAFSAPAPPSLDSLHETAKCHQEEFRRKIDNRPNNIDYYNLKDNASQGQLVKGHSRTPSEQSQGHHRTPSGQGHFRTPSSDTMSSSFEGRVTLATEENVDLDLDSNFLGQGVRTDENGMEFDPNYETVDEARSRVKYEEINGARPKEAKIRAHIYEEADNDFKYEVVKDKPKVDEVKIRAHVYEEVTVTNEARRTRQRVLNQHTYEEVTDVKGKGQEPSKGQGSSKGQGDGEGSNDVQKRKKGHERTASGDHSLFSKRKSGDGKDKNKDGKKKDGKNAGKKS